MGVLCTASNLQHSDAACLVDHLIMNANLLLRKRDRCRLLLQILESFGHETGRRARLQESIALLLENVPDQPERVDFSMKLLELEQGPPSLESVFKWLSEQSGVDPVRFYSIKMRYESRESIEEAAEADNEPTEQGTRSASSEPTVERPAASGLSSHFDELDHAISADLKTLSVFESIPDTSSFSFT